MSALSFRLHHYRLAHLHFAYREGIRVEGKIAVSPRIEMKHVRHGSALEVWLGVSVDDGNLPFVLEAAYQGTFTFDQDLSSMDPHRVSRAAQVDCPTVLFPFVAETIAETTRKAGLPPLVLRWVDFGATFEETSECGEAGG
jgi:preprotein translocase subunit SecB